MDAVVLPQHPLGYFGSAMRRGGVTAGIVSHSPIPMSATAEPRMFLFTAILPEIPSE